ncbi:MAG: alkaline phosphatase [Candidatus Colwellbacteria bacterium CG10_big_fil_rev_8_21_14_0_10_42_22]|uniref:Alkaline phosphatase n=1 Tax=Candidatus Colwellbacteria bacterium CG10_big_fil_rev_8_21_14_0_10_42_22 TaxID=1974540 RepID=A0A2H0VFA1_9BACT|nr:MAG: alkaline phosphatase [Candidatus Colwellbacteria bacterium CG10_big_fil_rev_8_21_14_0_10_42_22]
MIEHILETLSVFILNVIESSGYWGVFFLMAMESANMPIPSEVVMPFSGFLVSTGVFDFWPVILIATLGQLSGSLFSYYIATHFEKWTRKWTSHNPYYQKSKSWFDQYGVATAFWSRLMPVIRTFISFPAGLFRVNIWKFSIYTFLGAFIWTTILTYPGVYLGENWQTLEPIFRKFDVLIAILIIVGGIYAFKMHFKKTS